MTRGMLLAKLGIRDSLKGLDRELSRRLLGSLIGTYPYMLGHIGYYQFSRRMRKERAWEGFAQIYSCRSQELLEDILGLHREDRARECGETKSPKYVQNFDLQSLNQPENSVNTTMASMLRRLAEHLEYDVGVPDLCYRRIVNIAVYTITSTNNPALLSAEWHQDRRPINWMRLFILLHDTGLEDGPLSCMSEKLSRDLIRGGFSRGGIVCSERIGRAKEFVGKSGEILLVNTQTCLHKAGVPKEGRLRSIVEVIYAV